MLLLANKRCPATPLLQVFCTLLQGELVLCAILLESTYSSVCHCCVSEPCAQRQYYGLRWFGVLAQAHVKGWGANGCIPRLGRGEADKGTSADATLTISMAAADAGRYVLVSEPDCRANSFVGTEEYLAPEVALLLLITPFHVMIVRRTMHRMRAAHSIKFFCSNLARIHCYQRGSNLGVKPHTRVSDGTLWLQVIKGQGHAAPVDWWSLGILMYELLFGFTPFRGAKRDITFENVLRKPLKFPEEPVISGACQVGHLSKLCNPGSTWLMLCWPN